MTTREQLKMAPITQKSSNVWHFFVKIATGGKCKICNRDVKSGGSGGNTTNLKNHLLRNHSNNPQIKKVFLASAVKDKVEQVQTSNRAEGDSQPQASTSRSQSIRIQSPEFASMDRAELDSLDSPPASPASFLIESDSRSSFSSKNSAFQPRIDDTLKHMKSFEGGGSKSGEITNAILFMIAKDNLPFNTVEKEGFKYLMKTTVPLYSIPGRKSITKRMEEKYEYLSVCEKNKFETINYFSITADLWTDTLNTVSYLGMTAHYEFGGELQSTMIGVTEMTERHTADVIGKWLKANLQEWNIDEAKVVVFVTDNASNIVKAITDTFGANRHLPCFAHTLNLTATQTMDFPEANTLCTKIKTIVTFFKQSTTAAYRLRGISDLKLIQSVETRWNSTFYMLERFNLLSDKVGSILLNIPSSPPMLTATELQLAKEILEVLRPIEAVTKELCGEQYVTSSKIIPMINCLKKQVEVLRSKTQTRTALTLIERLQSNIMKRFGHIEANRLMAISTILDPRFKRLHFKQLVQCSQAINHIAKCMREIDVLNMSIDIVPEVNDENIPKDHSNDLWSHHEDLLKMQGVSEEERHQDEMPTDLRHYLNQPLAKLNENPMNYWSHYKSVYPILSTIARKFLPLVATSVPSERLFSRAGNILTDNRSRLSPDHLQQLLFLNSLSAKEWQLK